MLEGDGEAVGGRAGQAGGRDEFGEGSRRRAHGRKDRHCLVDDPHAARLVHTLILVSHDVRRQVLRENRGDTAGFVERCEGMARAATM